MRVLVCGGRDYADRARVWRELDAIDRETPITCIIEGGARGADRYAFHWAVEKQRARQTFAADWQKYRRAAGPIRNQRMLDEAKPDLVVAFPGGDGTADMVGRARKAGVAMREIIR